MPTHRVDLDKLGPALRRKIRERQREAEMVALQVAHRGVAECVRLTDEAGLVDAGGYKRAWRARKRPKGAEIRNGSPYAAVIEHGRRPMRPGPPYAPILQWVRRKLGLQGKEAEKVAWAVRTAIHRRGSPPKKVLARATKQVRVWLRDEMRRRFGR